MSSPHVNLQDSFLNQVRKEAAPVEVMLLNGATFRGVVRGFDNFTVIMNVDGKQHLVYKHSIAQLITEKFHRPNMVDSKSSPESKHAPHPKRGSGKPRGGHRKKEPKPVEKFNALDLSNISLKTDAADKDPKPQSEPEPKPEPKPDPKPEPKAEQTPPPEEQKAAPPEEQKAPQPQAPSETAVSENPAPPAAPEEADKQPPPSPEPAPAEPQAKA